MATLPSHSSVAQRISKASSMLTRSQRELAEHVMAHPLQVATMPIDELAATVGVSVATANRFARVLGFDGYPQFRAALVLGFESTLAPVQKLRSNLERPSGAADVFARALADIERNTASTRESLDQRSCERAVAAILKAQRIFIIGFGSSSWLGGLLQRSLDPYCDNVQLLASIEGSSYAARTLSRAQPGDLVVAIAFPRYFSDTELLARRARDAGVPVLALTDRVTSPLTPLASVALYAHTDSEYFANSEASVLALIEALCSAVAHGAKGSVKAAAQLAESVLPWLHQSSNRLRAQGEPAAAAPRPRRRTPR